MARYGEFKYGAEKYSASVRLISSDGTLDKRLRPYTDAYQEAPGRPISARRTTTGALDFVMGNTKRQWRMRCKIRETESDALFANLANLRTFHGYQSPQGTPSNALTFNDPVGGTHTVVMVGDLIERPFGPTLTGSGAWYYVEFELEEL